ncbi:MAG: DNA polymerase domain-containing protein [Candidatus Babeliales bacterium]|jgi:DNA polymerase elongation subunit (family B)
MDVWEIGGKHRQIMPPFPPYLYSLRSVSNSKMQQKRFLSDMKSHNVWKLEFNDTNELERTRNAYTIEDRFPFKMRVAIDVGYKFPSNYPSLLGWDTETITTGLSPDSSTDTIMSISAWSAKPSERAFFYEKNKPKETILEFLEHWKSCDPDVPVGFNDRFYDYPVLMQNCKRFGIRCEMGRDGGIPYILKNEFEKRGQGRIEHTVLLNGRTPFDIDKETRNDYVLTINGLKNRGLKEVARHFKLNPVEVDYNLMQSLSYSELEEYNLSDARCTYELGEIYFRGLWELADYLGIPVDAIITRTPSHIGNIVFGRAYNEKGIVSDGENKIRFPQLFGGKKANQGAFGKCYKTGIFVEDGEWRIVHKDFVSMYVNILRATNASPENTRLVSVKSYTGNYDFKIEGDRAIVEIPEYPHNPGDFPPRQVTVEIDLSEDSVLRKILDDLFAKRVVAKADWKRTGLPEYESRQNALKLVANSLWGYQSMVWSKYGSILVGIVDTGLGRYLIQNATELESKSGNIPLQIATDGIWELQKNPVEFDASTCLPSAFKTDLLQMDTEEYLGLIVIDEKNHIYRDKDGKTVKHGSTILGRSIPYVVDYFIDELADCLFKKQDPVDVMQSWSKKRIHKFNLRDFVSYKTLSKHPDDYSEKTMYANLIGKLNKAGIKVRYGERINFVKTIQYGYTPTVLFKDGMTIDTSYYQSYCCEITSKILGKPFKELKKHFDGDVQLEMFCE